MVSIDDGQSLGAVQRSRWEQLNIGSELNKVVFNVTLVRTHPVCTSARIESNRLGVAAAIGLLKELSFICNYVPNGLELTKFRRNADYGGGTN